MHRTRVTGDWDRGPCVRPRVPAPLRGSGTAGRVPVRWTQVGAHVRTPSSIPLTGTDFGSRSAAIRHHLTADVASLERVSANPARPTYSVEPARRDVVLKVLQSNNPRSIGCTFAAGANASSRTTSGYLRATSTGFSTCDSSAPKACSPPNWPTQSTTSMRHPTRSSTCPVPSCCTEVH